MRLNVPRLYRRAILIYFATIVAPVCGVLWLGLQSFARQQQALTTLSAEKLKTILDARTLKAAETAFGDPHHPVAKYFFTVDRGVVVQPALHAPAPRLAPQDFSEAEREELDVNRPDLALATYRKLLALGKWDSLALSRIARCLSKLGREEEAKATWRTLAVSYPDERDLSYRPYGIVAAMKAGDTTGLLEKITSGRWDLSADQAAYFVSTLDLDRTSPYLDRFRFASELQDQFRPSVALREGNIYAYAFGARRIFYRMVRADVISGFAANVDWIDTVLRPDLERELGLNVTRRQGLWLYGGATSLVLLVLSAGVVLLWRDISRETQTNRLRSDFVSGVTHELKTPITLIRLYGETLLRQASLRDGERQEFYRIITRESARLGRLVDQIQAFSRIERGDALYKFEEGDVAPIIAGVVDDYGEWLERAGFSLHRALLTAAPPVRFDPGALSQAVINLIDNAVKYSGSSRHIAVRMSADDRQVTVAVEDHGIGIPAGELDRIFERFYRSPNASGKGGYGLGLFMVRHIMDAHAGCVTVRAEPGAGSTFTLWLPVARAEP